MIVALLTLLTAMRLTSSQASDARRSREAEKFDLSVTSASSRIIGGEDATLGAFPWMAAVLESYSGSGDATDHLLCSGVLVAPRHVMTAGNCMTEEDSSASRREITFLIGAVDLSRWEEESATFRGLRYTPQLLGWNQMRWETKSTGSTDFAVVQLMSSVDLPYLSIASSVVESSTTLAGWGNVDGRENRPSTLQYLDDVPLLDDAECEAVDATYETSGERCAGSISGQGGCSGDVGGPLMVENSARSTRFELVGILVRTNTTCASGSPDVYFDAVSGKALVEDYMCGEGVPCPEWSSPATPPPSPKLTPQPMPEPTPHQNPTIMPPSDQTHAPTRLPSPAPTPLPSPLPSRLPTPVPSHLPSLLPTALPSQFSM